MKRTRKKNNYAADLIRLMPHFHYHGAWAGEHQQNNKNEALIYAAIIYTAIIYRAY